MEKKFSGAENAQDGAGYTRALVHAALHTSLGLCPGESDRSTLVHQQISSLIRKYEGVGVWGEKIPSSLKSKESKCEVLTASTMQTGMKSWCHHGRGGTLVKPVLFFIVPLHVTHVSLPFPVSASARFSLC